MVINHLLTGIYFQHQLIRLDSVHQYSNGRIRRLASYFQGPLVCSEAAARGRITKHVNACCCCRRRRRCSQKSRIASYLESLFQ